MITIRIFNIGIFPEAFVLFIIILVIGFACPAFMALDPEMIIGFTGQRTVPAVRFQDPLGEGYARRNTIHLHFLDSEITEAFNIFFNRDQLLGKDPQTYQYKHCGYGEPAIHPFDVCCKSMADFKASSVLVIAIIHM
jgi:hypothetical protein